MSLGPLVKAATAGAVAGAVLSPLIVHLLFKVRRIFIVKKYEKQHFGNSTEIASPISVCKVTDIKTQSNFLSENFILADMNAWWCVSL